ncbi:FIG00642822: hypothetical protein [Escherichia coli ISC41]|nr:FIG00642822: hypothetical protein [Escherichia coli ISC41]
MKSTTGINQQISKVQSAIMALKATNTDVQSITIRGNKPVIRVSRSAHCMRMLEQGKACYLYTGHDHRGYFRQGVFRTARLSRRVAGIFVVISTTGEIIKNGKKYKRCKTYQGRSSTLGAGDT